MEVWKKTNHKNLLVEAAYKAHRRCLKALNWFVQKMAVIPTTCVACGWNFAAIEQKYKEICKNKTFMKRQMISEIVETFQLWKKIKEIKTKKR